MSPTMTEGGIASWKKQEGEAFASGDVLLEVVRGDSLHSSTTLATRFASACVAGEIR